MIVTIELPDDIAQAFACQGNLSRRVLECFALQEFRAEHLSQVAQRRLLGFSTRYELDGFLKAHGEFMDYSIQEFNREWEDLLKAGF